MDNNGVSVRIKPFIVGAVIVWLFFITISELIERSTFFRDTFFEGGISIFKFLFIPPIITFVVLYIYFLGSSSKFLRISDSALISALLISFIGGLLAVLPMGLTYALQFFFYY